jgi:hypothetical protein
MKFDAQNNVGPTPPYQVVDANGVVLHKCIRGDTETGLVERYVVDDKGRYKLSDDGCHVTTIVERHPAPLVLKSLGCLSDDNPEVMSDEKGVRDMSYKFHSWYPRFGP